MDSKGKKTKHKHKELEIEMVHKQLHLRNKKERARGGGSTAAQARPWAQQLPTSGWTCAFSARATNIPPYVFKNACSLTLSR